MKLYLKIVVVGDAGIGKSNLIMRYFDDKFIEGYTSTIGSEFHYASYCIAEDTISLPCQDTIPENHVDDCRLRVCEYQYKTHEIHFNEYIHRVLPWRPILF